MRGDGDHEASARSLDHSLVSGMAWTAALRWPAQAISWIATAYAARLLSPADYGLVSMAMLAIGLVRMVEDFGLDAIFVQDRSIVGVQQARLAGFVLLAGGTLSLLFVGLAVPVSHFFGEAQVAPIVMLLSLLCVADALQVVPRAALQREMQFARLAWAQFLQVMVTQGTLVLGATLGWGVWALVFNSLAGAAAVTLLLLWWHPYRVSVPREFATLAKPLLQGWRVLASRIAYYGYSNADQVVVGKLIGKEALGAYSFATTLSTTLSQEIASVVSRVVPGIFSAVQKDPAELRRYFLLLTELVAYVTLPISVGIALTADYAVRIVLGPQWEAVVMPLRLLCIYAGYYTCQMLVGPVLLWTGQFRANMWCSVLAGVGLPLGFLAGSLGGLEGVALSWSIVFPLVNLPAMIIAFRTMRSGFLEWLDALMPAALASLVLSAAVLGARTLLSPDLATGWAAAIAVLAGALGYLAALGLLFRRRVLLIWAFLRALRSRREGVAPAA
ncbi:MAG: lipopolysaccharide biosynthesis protein [Piscinibacter sp.]